jgi:DNA-binding MarR family transcriptional regulator
MNDDIYLLLGASDKLNGRVVSLSKCLILVLLFYFMDGIQFRELKAALKMSDGKLISNLNGLRAMGYITKSEAEVDKRKVDVYSLTEKGRLELSKIVDWMNLIQKVASEGDEKCQMILTR